MAGYGNKPDDGRTPPGTLGIGWGEALQELYGGGKEMLQTIGKKVQSIYQVDQGGVNLASEIKLPVMRRVKEGWSKTVFGGGAPLEDERNLRQAMMQYAPGRHGSFPIPANERYPHSFRPPVMPFEYPTSTTAPLEDERNIRDDIAHFATGRHGSFPTGLPWSTKKY